MTSSETPTELPTAVARERDPAPPPGNPQRWRRYGVLAAAAVAGWVFVAYTHYWHLSAAVVFLCLGWLAVVAGAHNLWRTGIATSDPSDEDRAWWQPIGVRDELDREKRALLKAIKEVDFDRQTGKMSDEDAQTLTRVYRARAIEVMKAIEELEVGGAATVRQQIEREVKARVAVDEAAAAKAKDNKKSPKKTKPPAGKRAIAPSVERSETGPERGAERSEAPGPPRGEVRVVIDRAASPRPTASAGPDKPRFAPSS